MQFIINLSHHRLIRSVLFLIKIILSPIILIFHYRRLQSRSLDDSIDTWSKSSSQFFWMSSFRRRRFPFLNSKSSFSDYLQASLCDRRLSKPLSQFSYCVNATSVFEEKSRRNAKFLLAHGPRCLCLRLSLYDKLLPATRVSGRSGTQQKS